MDAAAALAALEAAPRLGWAAEPPATTELAAVADRLGVASAAIVRDDWAEPLFGGSKVRKLDFLLAAPPWRDAQHWASVGAPGSGHLVACTAAAQLLGRQFAAHVFWRPAGPGTAESLAHVASHAAALQFYSNRLALALRSPRLLLAATAGPAAVIPPGATHPLGMLGLVRAGLQLGLAIHRAAIPSPTHVYVAFGSGGTAVGLAAGLALAGVPCRIRAVLAVEPWLASAARLRSLQRALGQTLARILGELPPPPCPIDVDASQVGRGYAIATAASLQAVELLGRQGIAIEPHYTGKAFAALLQHRPSQSERLLFWNTVRRPDPLPSAPDWQKRLPPSWRAKLAEPAQLPNPRRQFLAVVGSAALLSVGARWAGHPRVADWRGLALDAAQAATLHAACEALLPPLPPAAAGPWPWLPCVQAADAYVARMPAWLRAEVAQLLAAVAHLPMAKGHALPFAALAADARCQFVDSLRRLPAPFCDCAAGLLGLVAMASYQLPRYWADLGYRGPMVGDVGSPARPAYARLQAPAGSWPPGLEAA